MHGNAARSIERACVKLDGVSRRYDPRVRAIRPDLADVALADHYFAPHYAAPVPRTCVTTSAMVRGTPSAGASAVTELLHGETFHMLDSRAGWAWGYCAHDHYVGYVPVDVLGEPAEAPAGFITRTSAPAFAAADIKSPVATLLPAGARIAGTLDGDFLATPAGHVHQRHIRPMDAPETDWVAAAQRYLGMPYVWGGRGGLGIDCSGLVQMALAACGIAAPRDTDQQAEALGTAIPDDAAAMRGDIIFFPGHVGLMVDEARLLHANAFWMAVTIEPLADVVARLAGTHEQPITARRRVQP